MKLIPVLLIALGLIAGCAGEPEIVNHMPVPNGEEELGIVDLEASYEQAKAEFQLDGSAREEYIEATVAFATATMHGPGAPREKYPRALELYAEALDLDPENEEALKNRQVILDIYDQMGRTPPSSSE